MPSQRMTDYTALQHLLQQADAEWETQTRIIQADQQRLEAVQQHRANLHLLLALDLGKPAKPCPALAAQCAAVECQLAQLEQKLLLERARRAAFEQQFDQARLALVTLRRMAQRRQSRRAARRKLLARAVKWLLGEVWAALQTFSCDPDAIPHDRPLGQRHLSPPTP